MCIIKGPAEVRNNYAIDMDSYIEIKARKTDGLAVDHNVFFSSAPKSTAYQDKSKNNLYADVDQEAMKQRIFRFKPGSPAKKLGINPLDMSKVGSTLAEGKQK